jgi:iron complex outermembrane receptor protein
MFRPSPSPRRALGVLLGALAGAAGLAASDRALAEPPPVANIEELELENLLVVTATLHEQSLLDAPAAITVVTAAEIKARGYRNIASIFADIVGFNEVSDTNEEIIGTRGVFASTTNKTLFLINGHRMNDVLLGRYNVDQYLGVDALERIEFIRGPASALYGTGALVGVVNFIIKKGRDVDGLRLKYQGDGVHANEASLTWGKLIGDYDVLFNVTFLDQKGEEIDQPREKDFAPAGQDKAPGVVYWRRYPENFSGVVNVRSEDSSITARGAHFRRVTPRGGNGAFYVYDLEPFRPTYTENDFFFDYSKSWTFGADGQNRLTLNPALHYFSYFEESFINFGANRTPPLGSRSGKAAEMNNYQLKLTYDRAFLDNLTATVGLDGLLSSMYRTNGVNIVNASRVEIAPAGYSDTGRWLLAGLFAQAVWSPLPLLTITAGGRYDTFQDEADPKFTPRFGVVFKPLDELALKLLYGWSYLAPMWAHKRAANADFMGDPTLKPETFQGGDLVAVFQNKRVSATADLYYNVVNRLINAPRDLTTNTFAYRNTGKSTYYGADLSGDVQILSWLRANGGYSYIAPRQGKTSTVFPVPSQLSRDRESILSIPTHTLRYGLRFDPLPSFSLSVWGRATSETRTNDPILFGDANPETRLHRVFLLDASASYLWERLTLQLVGTNLTNRYYERGGTVPRPLARNGILVEALVAYQF